MVSERGASGFLSRRTDEPSSIFTRSMWPALSWMTTDFESGAQVMSVRNAPATPSTGFVSCFGCAGAPSAAGLPSAGMV